MSMLREFKDFAIKGNMLDMAVGIIIGAEFGKIINSLVADVIMPPIGFLIGGIDFKNFFITLKAGTDITGPYASLAEAQKAGAITMNIGLFFTTAITFLIMAFAIFLIVRAANRLRLPQVKASLALLFLLSLPAHAALTSEDEASMVTAGGNSQLKTYNALSKNKYEFTSKNAMLFGGHYTYGESAGALSARNWDLNDKYEHPYTEHLSLIFGEVIEGNNFQRVKARYNSDLGARYYISKNDIQQWFGELSYRYVAEDRFSPDPNVYQSKARAYTEWARKQSETLQWKLWLEYLPNFTDGRDWMLTGEASMTAILNSVFSMKLAYKGLYDNLTAQPGLKNYDYITTTSLVAKF